MLKSAIHSKKIVKAILTNDYIKSIFPYTIIEEENLILCSKRQLALFFEDTKPKVGLVYFREKRAAIEQFFKDIK